MAYCEAEANSRQILFERFTLADMRPTATTERMDAGDMKIVDAIGHPSERMVRQVDDRRRQRKVSATL